VPDEWKNKLYFGDNLEIMRRYISDESVDLIYLDPPFNSKATYNVLFEEKNGTQSAAQITAFEDTWHWGLESEEAYHEVVTEGPKRLSDLLQALRQFLGTNDMMAYLVMMAIRLVEMHRVLKPTGSIYLHCDPMASHYLKLVMDAVFAQANFRNEIIWKRTYAHGSSRRYGPVHDVILFYSRGDQYKWTDLKVPADPGYIEQHFTHKDADGRRFQPITLTGAGKRDGQSGQPWRGINPTAVGRHWALPGGLLKRLNITEGTTQDKLDALDRAGMIYWPKKRGGVPRLKWYADQLEGVAPPDVWTDINPISPRAKERLGYPTQKPEALLERIIKASSNEGDTVMDPFCGCGTTIAVAERLNRRWIGIDITHLAITLMRHRLQNTFRSELSTYEVIGDPKDLRSAEALAEENRYQFEWWALGLVGARPAQDKKKGADTGIDGYVKFFDDNSGKPKTIVVQVKSGRVSVTQIRDLKGVVDREQAVIGAFITLQNPTRAMREEAATAGFYEPEHYPGCRYPKIQILTVREVLDGKTIDYPQLRSEVTFKKPPRKGRQGPQEQRLL